MIVIRLKSGVVVDVIHGGEDQRSVAYAVVDYDVDTDEETMSLDGDIVAVGGVFVSERNEKLVDEVRREVQ